jgi:hypothetical protein
MFPWFQAKPPPLACGTTADEGNSGGGTGQDFSSTSIAQEAWSISQLEAALMAIPNDDKADYVHALHVCPHLVETESDPIIFLRFYEWDATAAARRLTTYWRRRKEVFGETRAFLPVLNDFSGNGALGSDEIGTSSFLSGLEGDLLYMLVSKRRLRVTRLLY